MSFPSATHAKQVAQILRRIYSVGFCDEYTGNVSIKDDGGNIWLAKDGVSCREISEKDVFCIRPGDDFSKADFPKEAKWLEGIYKVRPNASAVIYAYPPCLMSFLKAKKLPRTDLLPSTKYSCQSAVFVKKDENETISDKIIHKAQLRHDCMLIEDGGVLVLDDDLESAYMRLFEFEASAKLDSAVSKLGSAVIQSEKHMTMYMLRNFPNLEESLTLVDDDMSAKSRKTVCSFTKELCKNGIFTPSDGTLAMRTGDDAFIISAYGKSHADFDEDDFVYIKNGMHEAAKTPSRSAELCRDIFKNNRDISAVIIARPTNLAAYCVTHTPLECNGVKTKSIPFGASFMQPDLTSREFADKTDALILENDSVLCVGHDLKDAASIISKLEACAKNNIINK